MTPSISLIKDLKERLKNLSLLFLGQHSWSLLIEFPKSYLEDNSHPICLCKCCEESRKSYQIATGIWPTKEQEFKAMREWGGIQ